LGVHPIGSPAGGAVAGSGAFEAALGRDENAVVGRQSLGDELLRDTWAVGVGRVDELDAQLDRSAQ